MFNQVEKREWLLAVEEDNNKYIDLSPLSDKEDLVEEYFLLSYGFQNKINGYAYLTLNKDDRGYYYQLSAFNFLALANNIDLNNIQNNLVHMPPSYFYMKLLEYIKRDYINNDDKNNELLIHSTKNALQRAIDIGCYPILDDLNDLATDFDSFITSIDLSDTGYQRYLNNFSCTPENLDRDKFLLLKLSNNNKKGTGDNLTIH